MKGIYFPGDRRVAFKDYPDPVPGPGQVVVKMKIAGLCGSDLHGYRQTAEQREGNTIIPGHEPSGIVESVGEGVTQVRPGDRVSVYHYLGCGHCKQCIAGNLMWCEERKGYGGPINGPFAEFLLTDERNCLPLPEELTFATGALMACAAGTAFSSMSKLGVSGLHTLAIFGQGPVGLCGLMMAKAMGGRVIGVEPIEERRELSRELGADEVLDPAEVDVAEAVRALTRGEGADLSFETSGSTQGRTGAIDVLKFGGKAVYVGHGAQEPAINPSRFIGKQLTLMGSFVLSIPMYYDMVDFILDRGIELDHMITHRYELNAAKEAFRTFDSGRTGKVVFEWD